MNNLNSQYISIFSGIGGLELPAEPPALYCEQDKHCRKVLSAMHPDVPICSDVRNLRPPQTDIVAGGWPCQDISSAGPQRGMQGERSSLFWEMVRVAHEADAHTIVGENVPNLLTIHKGKDFDLLLTTLADQGFKYIGWRIINARAFNLPQHRRRLFIVASKRPEHAWSIHAQIPAIASESTEASAAGFYWTGGKRSICFSRGFVPALKIGASDGRGRAPVAIFKDNVIRKLSAREFLRLQGFSTLDCLDLSDSILLNMAGNAVAAPVGQFVMNSAVNAAPSVGFRAAFGIVRESGFYDNGVTWVIEHDQPSLAHNLDDFLDKEGEPLSAQACAGLLVRSVNANAKLPLRLFQALRMQAANRSGRLRPSRSNSFEQMDQIRDQIEHYAAELRDEHKYG